MKIVTLKSLSILSASFLALSMFLNDESKNGVAIVKHCYKDLQPSFSQTCFYMPFTLTEGETCSNSNLQLNKGLDSSPFSYQNQTECNSGSYFCCARVIVDPIPCNPPPPPSTWAQPIVSFVDSGGTFRVSRAQICEIYCKSEIQ